MNNVLFFAYNFENGKRYSVDTDTVVEMGQSIGIGIGKYQLKSLVLVSLSMGIGSN